jgi:predicted dithiol-disulfide oxidoreductase (DUF899 family)
MLKIKTVRGTENRKVVSQKEWLTARVELLEAEKELTRAAATSLRGGGRICPGFD